MKVWITFLLGCFVVGGLSLRKNKPDRPALFLLLCVVVAAAMYSGRLS
jgi:uncharacterized membrane protein